MVAHCKKLLHNGDGVWMIDAQSVARLILKLAALERKPSKRVKFVKGWVITQDGEIMGLPIDIEMVLKKPLIGTPWGVLPAVITITLPNVGKGKAK